MTKHAPESNEADYAFYLPAAHKNVRPKDTWHTWQVRRVRLIDPLFISKTTVFLWQQLKETTFKLVQSCTPSINSFRSKYEKVLGLWHKLCMQAHMQRDTQTQTPYHRTPLFVDLIEYRIKTGWFLKWCLSESTLFVTKTQATQKERKS